MYSRFRPNKPLVLFAFLVFATLFLPATANAGNGKYRDGKFDFCVSVRFNATAAQLQRIREVFEAANLILHDATDGVHHFGAITIVNNSGASEAADFWINPGNALAYSPVGTNFGVWGEHINMFYDNNFGDVASGDGLAITVVHEFGHYAYDLGDEYSGPGFLNLFTTDAECAPPGSDTPQLNYCIMDNYWVRGARPLSYSLNEFCSQGNHDDAAPGNPGSANNTYQQYEHGMSCWEWISVNPKSKWQIPAKNPPQEDGGFALTTPTINSGSPDRRFMLLLDRSGSMAFDSKMTFAQVAGNNFILDVPDNTQVGIASFSDSGRIDFFLSPITEGNRQQAINSLFALTADGNTNIGGGLQIALAELEAQNDSCCTQAIVLISDGDHNVGTPPSAVIDSLIDAGVTVFTIGIGNGISASGEFTLQDIARQTGGKYYRVPGAFNLGTAIESILFSDAIGSGPSRRQPLSVTTGQVTEVPVLVEQGAARAAFVVDKASSADNITLSLRSPSGLTINPIDGSGSNPNIRYRTTSFTNRYQIFNPEPGTWTMIVTAGSITNGNLNVAGLIEHEGTKLSAVVRNELATYPQPFRVMASAMWEGQRVVGASVTGNVIHPQGVSVPITLYDDGSAEHGDDVPADGIYSENFNYAQQFGSNYRTGLPIAGTYTIELTTTNTNGTKFQGEVGLFPGTPPPPSPAPAFTRLASTTAIVANVPADTTAPSCQPTSCSSGSPASCDITVQDTGVGLSVINVVAANNVNVTVPAFTAGTTAPVVVTGTLVNANSNGSFELQCIDVVGHASNCSRTVTAAAPPILADDFNDNSIDPAKWLTQNSFTGWTNLGVPITETAQRVEIGPLVQIPSTAYRGLRTVNSFNFTGANSYVELVQAPSSATDAEALFDVGNNPDMNNISKALYYRIYVSHGTLLGERRTSSTVKTTLFSIPYDPVAHRFLRIRHNSTTGNVTLDTAPGNSGVPGTWVTRYTETWHSAIPRTSVLIEFRGGTFKQESVAPGKVIFDNFAFSLNGP